jgi:hypothetical protein
MDMATGIKELADEWESKLKKIPWKDADERIKAYAWGKGSYHWRLLTISDYGQLSLRLREEEKFIKGRLHGRQRRDMRMSINGATAAREKSRVQGKLTAVIRSICGTHTEPYSLHQLLLPNGETTSDPLAIHDAHTAHWRQWFLGDDLSNFFSCHEIDWIHPQEHRDDFMNFPAHIGIPANILDNIWTALTVPKFDSVSVRSKLTEITSLPVTLDDLRLAIAKSSTSSVPGPSGLSYAMMKTWTPKVLKEAFDAMTMVWETGQIPNWWKKKWICPKAKIDPSLATLEDLRPISLLKTTRKIWMGIIVGRIVAVWEEDEVLTNGQYGFRKGRGCEAPTLQVLNALEDAEEAGTEIHGSSWDIKRAFDSVSKPILQMSWQRLGVPRHIAKYIVDLDKECLTIPLTPHAMHVLSSQGLHNFDLHPSSHSTASGFHPHTGTAQGDTPSPVNWNATLDVLLRALQDIDPTPFLVRTDIDIHPISDTAYADDLFSISARREGLQLKADTVSAFTIIFGIKIAIHKLRTFAKCWGDEPSHHRNTHYDLLTYDDGWIPHRTPVRYVEQDANFDSVFKYLGVHIDVNNRFKHQYNITAANIAQASLSASSRQASAETIASVMVISPFRKAAFPSKYCPWNLNDHRALDIPVNSLYKHHLHLMPSNPNAALYMPVDTGGLGLQRLSDTILIDKWAMIWRGLHADTSTRIATEGLLHRALRLGHTDTDTGYHSLAIDSQTPQLLTGLIELTNKCGLSLSKGGSSPAHTPSHLIINYLNLASRSPLVTKFMNHRMTTLADLMIFAPDDSNHWADALIFIPTSMTSLSFLIFLHQVTDHYEWDNSGRRNRHRVQKVIS